uniref:Uncharacterized protein n=1 Tax=Arundo donax TaxID=35708 RepID=A0A0A9EXH5_ARUDO
MDTQNVAVTSMLFLRSHLPCMQTQLALLGFQLNFLMVALPISLIHWCQKGYFLLPLPFVALGSKFRCPISVLG